MISTLRFWTDFGDGAVLAPIGVAVAIVLAALAQWRPAAAWTIAVGGAWATIVVLKFLGYALAAAVPVTPLSAIDLVTPSGHVASSGVIYGGLAGLLTRRPGSLLARTLVATLVVAVAIGITRVLLDDHSVAEVIVGAVVCLLAAATLARRAGAPLERWVVVPVLAVVGAILVLRFGSHFTWESSIRRLAVHMVGAWRGSD